MKTNTLSALLCTGLIAVLLAFSGQAYAQKTYVWDDYKLQITVPSDFRVKKNTSESFEMKGEGMELIMELVEEDISLDELEEATVAGANEMELTEVDKATSVSSNGLKGYYVEGFKDGSRIMFAGMLDPQNQTNFFIAIVFDDDDAQAEKDAIGILNSLRRLR